MSTNTNTSTTTSDPVLGTDIYEISNFIDNIRANNVDDLSETSSMVGMFGYMNEIFSQSLQNDLIVVSETSNETIPTRAKFAKNVIAHAMNLSFNKITATPSIMTLMIYLPEQYIESNFFSIDSETGKAKFIFDKDIPINIGKYEFHVDYDIIITRTKLSNGEYQYSAMYDLFENGTTSIRQKNPISDITNPYITTIVKYKIDNVNYIAFSIRAHQVSNVYITKNILSDNIIENKTLTFDFDDQLAAFDIDVTDNEKTTHLTPVYNGLMDYTITGKWCYYEYLNENTIRIKFDRDSYVPSTNSVVTINIKLTEGSGGNFTYNQNFKSSLKSKKYNNYNGMYMFVYPLQNGIATQGRDKKSIADLKKIIPREASSRGAIINTTDLTNYFNSINDDECKLYFYKKRDNPFERLYYANMLVRKDSYVLPTNTLSLKIDQNQFKGNSKNNNLSINPGTIFYYYDHGTNVDNDYATVSQPDYLDDPKSEYEYDVVVNEDGNIKRLYKYISPFLITIGSDLVSSYLLTIMNDNKSFKFDSINSESNLQFVATNMNWSRKFIYNYIDEDGDKRTGVYDNKYTMSVDIVQNNNNEYGMVKYHIDGNGNMVFDDIRVRMIMVLYSDSTSNTPYRYVEANLDEYDPKTFSYTFKFTLETDDLMDLNNRINIKGVYNTKPEDFQKSSNIKNSHGYFNKNTYAKIFILADFGTKAGDVINGVTVNESTQQEIIYGTDGNRAEIETILPTKKDIVNEFLKNNISTTDKNGFVIDVVSIMRNNSDYMLMVKKYNNDEQETENAIMKYLRNNKNSDFVQNTLLKDDDSIKVINSYKYEDLSRYTLCNTFTVDDGIDFYYDYSKIMSSVINIAQIQKTTEDGKLIYKEIDNSDEYIEYEPVFDQNKYRFTINRIPMIKSDYLNTEAKMQDFIYDLDIRRKYINECMSVLEDTFSMDLKFFNTYGPSRMFYYNNPSAQSYKAKIAIESLNVYASTIDEDDGSAIAGSLSYGDTINIEKIKGQWGYISTPYEGWVKLSSITKIINYIDNVALTMNFALQAQTSGDKYISTNIIRDIKDYVEDINEINELHIPNIITLITNNYRDQLVYFEYLGLNDYNSSCQHLYMDTSKDIETCPEFLNIETSDDGSDSPKINITVY